MESFWTTTPSWALAARTKNVNLTTIRDAFRALERTAPAACNGIWAHMLIDPHQNVWSFEKKFVLSVLLKQRKQTRGIPRVKPVGHLVPPHLHVTPKGARVCIPDVLSAGGCRKAKPKYAKIYGQRACDRGVHLDRRDIKNKEIIDAWGDASLQVRGVRSIKINRGSLASRMRRKRKKAMKEALKVLLPLLDGDKENKNNNQQL